MKSILGDHERIVITGVGLITDYGFGLDSIRPFCVPDDDCVRSDPPTSKSSGSPRFSGHIDDFRPISEAAKKTIRKSLKVMNRQTRLGVAAVQHAIADGNLLAAHYPAERVGVCFGAGNVEIDPADFVSGVESCRQQGDASIEQIWGKAGIPEVEPLWILRVLPNMPACHIAIICDFQGPNNTITQNAVSLNQAVYEAYHHLLDDEADAMVVGACGTAIRECVQDDDTGDRHRSPSEAAAAFVLERFDIASQRGATIYGEVLASSSRCAIDGTRNPKPDEAAIGAITAVLASAGVQRDQALTVSLDPWGETERLGLKPDAAAQHLDLYDVFGDVEAASGAVGLASAISALRQSDWPVAVNVNVTSSGLASCVALGSAKHLRAA